MPQITLSDALRYFFSPAAFYFYLCMYDIERANSWQQQLSIAGTISGFVFGSVVYFLYRFYIYDTIIPWLLDAFRKTSYRSFIRSRYVLPETTLPWRSSWQALQIYHRFDDERLRQPNQQLRASGIHLLYQAGLLALPFFILAILNKGWGEISFFGVCAVILLVAAVGMDSHYESEELVILKSALDKLDDAAKLAGFPKRP